MTDDAKLIERLLERLAVAKAEWTAGEGRGSEQMIADYQNSAYNRWLCEQLAPLVIAERDRAYERAAEVAERFSRTMHSPDHTDTGKLVAFAIRRLKDKTDAE